MHQQKVGFCIQSEKLRSPEDIDRLIRADIPDPQTEPILHALVVKYMLHGPCGPDNPSCPCMVDGVSILQSTIQ